jgi:hypothetical protein
MIQIPLPAPCPPRPWPMLGCWMVGEGPKPSLEPTKAPRRSAPSTDTERVVHVPWRRRTEPCGCVVRTRQTPTRLSVVVEVPCAAHRPVRP